jgi:hypothetical protein
LSAPFGKSHLNDFRRFVAAPPAPDRSQASHPPPRHAAQARFRGSSSSIGSPCSSQGRGTRTRCVTSGPR